MADVNVLLNIFCYELLNFQRSPTKSICSNLEKNIYLYFMLGAFFKVIIVCTLIKYYIANIMLSLIMLEF